MPSIRKWWPDISNAEIDELCLYGCYELLIIRRLITNGIGGGKEISKPDLLQSVPKDKMGFLEKAVESLERKQFLVKKPKPGGLIIYQVSPKSYTESLKKLTDLIRSDRELTEALRNDCVSFIKTSDSIVGIIRKQIEKRTGEVVTYSITASEKMSFTEEHGVILSITFRCPNIGCHRSFEYEILDPREIFTMESQWECECGRTHHCLPFGGIREP